MMVVNRGVPAERGVILSEAKSLPLSLSKGSMRLKSCLMDVAN